MKKFVLIIVAIIISLSSYSQKKEAYILFGRVIDGDTIPYISLKEVNIIAFRFIENQRQARKLKKLIRNVKKVYPYAKIAGIKFEEYGALLDTIEDRKKQRRLMKKVENELKAEFGEDLKDLTFSQGKILIKLVDRETGNSSYSIVKELRGGFSAFFYQTFARIFGFNLKTKYDPEGKDKTIETIVKMIESGQI